MGIVRVRLRNYGYYADLLGGPLVELEMPGGTLGDLLAAVNARFGVDLEGRRNLRLIVGDRVLHAFPADLRLEDGVEVAVVPVVAGGDGGRRLEGRRGWARRHTRVPACPGKNLWFPQRGEESECSGRSSWPRWSCS